ncbi:MAG: hypothetical protein ACTS73_03905 [Arsenophonus sp. NEOnobi-MAG3]
MMSIHVLKQLISPCPAHIVRVNMLSAGEHSLGLQRYRCKILNCRKTFKNLTESPPLAKLHHKDKCFTYLRCILNSLTLWESVKQRSIDLKTALRWCRYHYFIPLLHRRQPT